MLKKVVLPAPFGPIRLTIDLSGIVKSRSLTAIRPPNSLRMLSATSRSRGRSPISGLRPALRLVGDPRLMQGLVDGPATGALLDLTLAPPLRDQACRTEEHHQHDDCPVDAEGVLRDLDLLSEHRHEEVAV